MFFLAVALFAAITEAVVFPSQHGSNPLATTSTPFEKSDQSFSVKGTGVLQLPVAKRKFLVPGRKRQSLDPLSNNVSGYSIQIGVGTPPQWVEVNLDTGSSELWVNPTCANAYYPYGCTQNGHYNPSSSSTRQLSSSVFSITYGLGSVSGLYIKDNIALGGMKIAAQQFGAASTSKSQMEGIMGVGWGYGLDTNYYNVIDQLAAQGITHSRAFSLDLSSIDVSQGSIIFGGIDTMKFTGVLEKRPIIPHNLAPDGYPRYWINMTSLGVTAPGSAVSVPVTNTPTISQPVFPDSGSTFCYLPPALFSNLLAFFPFAVNQGSNEYSVPCSMRTQNGTIDFGFGGTTIHVSYHEFFWFDGVNCWLAALPSNQVYLLGDSFMRSAYVVYDQDNSNVFLAQAANCGSNIIPITMGANAVPSVLGGCTPPNPTPSSSTSTSVSTDLSSSSSSSKQTSFSGMGASTFVSSVKSRTSSTSTIVGSNTPAAKSCSTFLGIERCR